MNRKIWKRALYAANALVGDTSCFASFSWISRENDHQDWAQWKPVSQQTLFFERGLQKICSSYEDGSCEVGWRNNHSMRSYCAFVRENEISFAVQRFLIDQCVSPNLRCHGSQHLKIEFTDIHLRIPTGFKYCVSGNTTKCLPFLSGIRFDFWYQNFHRSSFSM